MNELALDMLHKVERLEDELLKMPQADIVTQHVFSPGIYERRITVPPWTVLTGAAHKSDYKVRLERGIIAVNTEDGVKVLEAYLEFDGKAGLKRAGRVFDQEVIWVDIYENADDCTDLEMLEERLYVVPDVGMGDARARAQLGYENKILVLEG
jgi:hypothetical protein